MLLFKNKLICCLVVWCFVVCFTRAQENAYYLTNHCGADLLKVSTETSKIEEVISFKDTIAIFKNTEKSVERYQSFVNPMFLDATVLSKQSKRSKLETISSVGPSFVLDSVLVEGVYHKFHIFAAVSHYVGGGPDERIDVNITVENIGVLFSYSNYYNQHTALMMYHENAEKQKIIREMYKQFAALKVNTVLGSEYILELMDRYSYKNIVSKLEKDWLQHQNNIRLIHQTVETKDEFVYLTSTIKNISDKLYVFEKSRVSIAPTKITIYYPTTKENISLAGSYQQGFLQNLKSDVYLHPKEEVTFTQKLPLRTGCGSCTKNEYSGFQFINYGKSLYKWLLQPKRYFNNRYYFIFPTQEIKS